MAINVNDASKLEEDHRPWGYYRVLSDEATHKVKRIVVYGYKRLSLQRHQHRTEHWYVVEGMGLVTLDNEEIPLKAGQAVDIRQASWHRMTNPGKRIWFLLKSRQEIISARTISSGGRMTMAGCDHGNVGSDEPGGLSPQDWELINRLDWVAVIMAGGTGTRFWPLSTTEKPKQFLKLFDDRSLLQKSYDRIADLMPPERIMVLTNATFVSLVQEQLPMIPPENIIGEPMKRDTAAAVCLGGPLPEAVWKSPHGCSNRGPYY